MAEKCKSVGPTNWTAPLSRKQRKYSLKFISNWDTVMYEFTIASSIFLEETTFFLDSMRTIEIICQ